MNLILKDIITINNDYLNYLRSYEPKVLLNHNDGLERPNISVLVDNNGQLWAIPMTSNKSGRQDTEATFNLIEPNDKDNPNKGALLFFNMIPVVEGTYKSAFKAYGNYTSYISLLKKQQEIKKIDPSIIKTFKEYKNI